MTQVTHLNTGPDKDPTPAIEDTPVNIAAWRIDDLVRRLMTREITFAELHVTVKEELEGVYEAGHMDGVQIEMENNEST